MQLNLFAKKIKLKGVLLNLSYECIYQNITFTILYNFCLCFIRGVNFAETVVHKYKQKLGLN